MRCPRCAAENSAGMRFCGQCGSPLGTACPICGAGNPPEARACAQCGAPLAVLGAGVAGGELKQVSVLFCDIVGSTALTERLGAEAMRDLVARFLDLSAGEVRRLDGVMPQFRGDGFMAVFGAPRTQEDHARRALFAALAIRRGLGGETGDGEPGALDLPVRIGIHSGPVVFGPVGGGFAVETVIGDTPNVAARLQEAAEPGAVVISDATRALAQGYARVQPIGPLAVRGKSEPVEAYRLIGVSRSRARETAAGRSAQFVDRTEEMAALLGFVGEAEAGRGLTVGIVGEPGIGKSRLLDELRRRLAPGRVTWTEGRCASYGAAIPYLLLLDLLRSNCGIGEADTPETITRKVRWSLRVVGIDPDEDAPLLLRLLGVKTGDDLPPLPPEIVKQRAFEAFRKLAVNGSRRRPLVLALEDLHWVDALSAEFAAALAEEIADTRILILVTWRPGHVALWAGRPATRQIELQPLGGGESLNLLQALLPSAAPADPVTAEILARADGNPLFIEQLALHTGEAKEQRSELMVPATIHDVVMARIDRLPEEAKRLLQTAAVLGREFSLRLVRAVWEGTEPVASALRELCRLEFLDEWPDDEGTTYVFRHALTRDAAYGSLLARDRRRRHAAVGHALETLYAGRTEEVAELLAFHFGASGEAEKAVDYALAAAEKSQRRWANAEALAYFEDAQARLDALPDTPPNRLRRIDAVLKQAEVNYALGQYGRHLQALTAIRRIVGETDEPARQAAWHYWTGFLHSVSGGRPDVAIEHCRAATKIASEAGLDEIGAFARSCLTQVYMVAGKLRDAIEVGEEALSGFESRGNRWWAGRTLWLLSAVANYRGDWQASLNYCKRGLEHGILLNDLRLKAAGWTRLGTAHLVRGDIATGLHCCDEALALSPLDRDAAWARVVRGFGKIKAGRIDEGIAELNESLAWFESARMRWTQIIGSAWLAEGYLRRGDRASARPLIDRILATSRTTGYVQYEGRACWLMAECLAGEALRAAEDLIDAAIRIFRRIEARNDLARAMVTQAALRQRAGDGANARRLLDDALAIFDRLDTLDECARVKAALAGLGRGAALPLLADS